ncbi:unnamed protein product, partial [Allacma fusca]
KGLTEAKMDDHSHWVSETSCQILLDLQLHSRSYEDCILLCCDGVEIPIHIALFRASRWCLSHNSTPTSHVMSIDLTVFTLEEIAPILALLYLPHDPIESFTINVRSMQALRVIQNRLSREGFNITIPEISISKCRPSIQLEKFKFVKLQTGDVRKSFHYIVSTKELRPSCNIVYNCTFSGSNDEELRKHALVLHGVAENEQPPEESSEMNQLDDNMGTNSLGNPMQDVIITQAYLQSNHPEFSRIDGNPVETIPTPSNLSHSELDMNRLTSTPINSKLSARCRPVKDLINEMRAQGKVWL